MEEKDSLKLKHFNQKNNNIYRGFFPFLPNDPSHKEFYDMTRPLSDLSEKEKKSFPMYEEKPWFRDEDGNIKYKHILDVFEKYFKIMHKLCLGLISILAEGLGKRPDYFDPWFKDECSSTFRAIHYLPRSHDRAEDYS